MDNMYYFLGMRLMSNKEIEEYADFILPKLAIEEKRNSIVKTLSGGQKRKLQLLLAMTPNTKLILLDEPSSGMDPTARRDTWDFIKEFSKGRIIIMTTHYMDEADALADRIGIMSKGQLQICGSSLFLRNHYGICTLLEISKIDSNKDLIELENFINSFFPEKHLRISGKLDESNLYIYELPNILSTHLTEIFSELDNLER